MRRRNLLAKFKIRNVAFLSLAIIFSVLLIQTSLLLFIDAHSSEGLEQMDVVFRTTLSSLFGFFISSAYTGKKSEGKGGDDLKTPKQIGFIAEDANSKIPQMSWASENEKTSNSVKLENATEKVKKIKTEQKRVQGNGVIIVLSAVCLFCITMMIAVRNFSHLSADATYTLVTLSLYRDFISSSIGAIIGMARGADEKA